MQYTIYMHYGVQTWCQRVATPSHLDSLVDRPRGNDIDPLLVLALAHTCPPPCQAGDKVAMRVQSLDTASSGQLPHTQRLVIGH